MTNSFDAIVASLRHPIGPSQINALRQVAERRPVIRWSDWTPGCGAGVVVVDEVPRLLEVEETCRLLPADVIVVILMSEHPAFDFLKSRLTCHGVIGTNAPEAPHQVWWGATAPAPALDAMNALQNLHVVTCVRRDTPEEAEGLALANGLKMLGISYTIEYLPSYLLCDDFTPIRSRLLLRAWEGTDKPLIWIDPGLTLELPHIPATLIPADFSAIPRPDAQVSTGIIYFARTPQAFDLLRTWRDLCEEFYNLPAAYLLDAAWATVMAQRPLVTTWMSPEKSPKKNAGTAAPPSFSYPAQRDARRAGRTGAPEPCCLIRSKQYGSDIMTLIVQADTGSAMAVASTIRSAIDAFSLSDGGFCSLAVMIANSRNDAIDIAARISFGWLLFASAGALIQVDGFSLLAGNIDDDRPIFVPPSNQPHATERRLALHVINSQGFFCRAETIANTHRRAISASPDLSAISNS